jgi:Tol biopolymer transport system component
MKVILGSVAFAVLALAASAGGATEATYRAAIYAIRDDGTNLRLIAQPEPAVPYLVRSPGGRSILYARQVDGVWALFAADRSGSNPVRLSPPNLPVTDFPTGAFSPDGRMIAFTSFVSCGFRCYRATLYLVRRDGSDLRLLAENAAQPSWASDSRRLAYGGSLVSYGAPRAIYVTDVESKETTRVAKGDVARPVWAPRRERIAYTANRGYGVACFVNADGSRRRCTRGHSLTHLVWSRDGRRVAFKQAHPRRLGFVDSYAQRVRYLGYHGRWARPAVWSPDGKRLAFLTDIDESPLVSVRVLRIATPKRSVRIIDDSGLIDSELRWRGREISYVALN